MNNLATTTQLVGRKKCSYVVVNGSWKFKTLYKGMQVEGGKKGTAHLFIYLFFNIPSHNSLSPL